MPDDLIELELEGMAHGGSAFGRASGQIIFVPFAIPGERILARIVGRKGRAAFAEGVTLLEASADRAFPECPHFGPGRCGGCQWQHISYEAQLLLKQDVLADQLARLGGLEDAPVAPVIAAPQPWGYAHRLTLYPAGGDVLALPRQDEGLQPIDVCLIAHPDLLPLRKVIQWDELVGLSEVTLQVGSDGAPMVVLRTASDEAPELLTDLPISVNQIVDDVPVNLVGDMHSLLLVGERRLRATAGVDFPPNLALVPTLLETALAALDLSIGQALLIWEDGPGLYSAFAAPRCDRLSVLTQSLPAAADIDFNLSDADNLDLYAGDPAAALGEVGEDIDAALVAPPPSGLPVEVLDGLARLAPPRLVYVSSDAATLARDAKRLTAAGWQLTGVQPLDLWPQTARIDAVARFERVR